MTKWFYFDLNNQFDAKRMGKNYAVYGGAIMSEKNRDHENMRRDHRSGSKIHRVIDLQREDSLAELVRGTARSTGPLSETKGLPIGVRLEFLPAA